MANSPRNDDKSWPRKFRKVHLPDLTLAVIFQRHWRLATGGADRRSAIFSTSRKFMRR
jgi:hypothetical protein